VGNLPGLDYFRVSPLASSSTGNVTYIETPQHKVLVDAGLSGKKVELLMESIGRTLKEVDSLFVTHEHSDHIRGVGVLARRYPQMNIYTNAQTWQAMLPKIGKVPAAQRQLFPMGTTLSLGDLDVTSFGVSHDAIAPQFYEFHHSGESFVIVTDTGYVSERVEGVIKDATCYLFEANHDTEMLREGMYPWPLKQRIMSDLGHLSNVDGAHALMDVVGNDTKHIFLGHLSQENNMKSLAHMTVAETMAAHDLGVDHDFYLHDTDPLVAVPLLTL
jgi:phosphoribosyl 1,2-cyclic phosphodiesterase